MSQRVLTYVEAIREAQAQEIERDPRVFVFGLGVDDHKGTMGSTVGLFERYGGKRVFDTPLSEDAMTGVAIGAAIAGLRPIHVHIRMDFMLLAMNQLVNMAAKGRYMHGGNYSVPIVVRSIIGRSWGQGAQHSQALQALFMHIPGLKVVAPSTPFDAKGCLVAAVRDDNPVMFIEHRMLYSMRSEVPEKLYSVPLGKARVLAKGKDITLVGVSYMAVECLRAKEYLEKKGISVEVIDPVTLSPLDSETISNSALKTGNLLVVDAGWTTCGVGAEILALIAERLGQEKRVNLKRLGFENVPCPTTKNLENLYYPNAQRIASLAYKMVTGNRRDWIPEESEAEEVRLFKGPF